MEEKRREEKKKKKMLGGSLGSTLVLVLRDWVMFLGMRVEGCTPLAVSLLAWYRLV